MGFSTRDMVDVLRIPSLVPPSREWVRPFPSSCAFSSLDDQAETLLFSHVDSHVDRKWTIARDVASASREKIAFSVRRLSTALTTNEY